MFTTNYTPSQELRRTPVDQQEVLNQDLHFQVLDVVEHNTSNAIPTHVQLYGVTQHGHSCLIRCKMGCSPGGVARANPLSNADVGNWMNLPAHTFCYTKQNRTSTCQLELECSVQSLQHRQESMMSIQKLRVHSIDIECQGRKGFFPDATQDPVIQIANHVTKYGEEGAHDKTIFCLDSVSAIAGANVLSFKTEKDMLLAWSQYLKAVDADILTGYNVSNFDFPYLLNRAATLKITDAFSYWSRRIGFKTPQPRHIKRGVYTETRVEGRAVFDLWNHIKNTYPDLKNYGLNSVAQHFLGEQKEDVHHSIIADLQQGNEETRRRLAVYCLKDAYLPIRLMEKSIPCFTEASLKRTKAEELASAVSPNTPQQTPMSNDDVGSCQGMSASPTTSSRNASTPSATPSNGHVNGELQGGFPAAITSPTSTCSATSAELRLDDDTSGPNDCHQETLPTAEASPKRVEPEETSVDPLQTLPTVDDRGDEPQASSRIVSTPSVLSPFNNVDDEPQGRPASEAVSPTSTPSTPLSGNDCPNDDTDDCHQHTEASLKRVEAEETSVDTRQTVDDRGDEPQASSRIVSTPSVLSPFNNNVQSLSCTGALKRFWAQLAAPRVYRHVAKAARRLLSTIDSLKRRWCSPAADALSKLLNRLAGIARMIVDNARRCPPEYVEDELVSKTDDPLSILKRKRLDSAHAQQDFSDDRQGNANQDLENCHEDGSVLLAVVRQVRQLCDERLEDDTATQNLLPKELRSAVCSQDTAELLETSLPDIIADASQGIYTSNA